ncbi:helix-turn-helix transcriptional regulator [Microbacterium sp. No. 7]|uniref:helix-turn-helix transcriptional regulator n=1 Tax=Microbacterium sp. No. 7 TaxID=1714373 RepID=UPI0006CFB3E6|nr:LuxR C-terminal-related transcriptional regulator [Microbacterium sp. No. 7]
MTTQQEPARASSRRWMIALVVVHLAAQLADVVWPRTDERAGSPASFVFAATLFLLLALYPSGRSVPRWMIGIAALAVGLVAVSVLVGPDVAERFLWPLPLAPLLLLLVIGGQGYRYWRRSSAAERESVRWPLLGALLLLTLVVPADLMSVLLTGSALGDPPPVVSVLLQVAFLLPGAGFLAGLVAPRTELVDRLLALWLAVVVAGAVLGAVFAAVHAVTGMWLPPPWPAPAGAAAAVVAGIWVVPLARRLGRRLVFRGRADEHAALSSLMTRLRNAVDPVEIPAQFAESVRVATGARSVVLRRSGHVGVWAQAGPGAEPDHPGRYASAILHLGLPLADLTVWPRPAESALSGADRHLVDTLAAAAAPALHGARLASAFPELTDRERQVLAGIVRGLPNTAIAERLGVSSKTIANYVSIVLTKLRVPDRERAAELARRRGAELG